MPREVYRPRVKPLVIAPEAAPGKNMWGGTTAQAFSRFLVATYFFINTVTLLQRFDKDTGEVQKGGGRAVWAACARLRRCCH